MRNLPFFYEANTNALGFNVMYGIAEIVDGLIRIATLGVFATNAPRNTAAHHTAKTLRKWDGNRYVKS